MYRKDFSLNNLLSQSTGAVEYTECTSAVG